MFHVPENFRVKEGPLASSASDGNNGAFQLQHKLDNFLLSNIPVYYSVIASDGCGWEHVSVQIKADGLSFTPNWDEMCFIKSVFWDEEDCVIQLHPSKSVYVNNHPNVLHLWRPTNKEIPTPPSLLVGLK